MHAFQQIIVPIDFSSHSDTLADLALNLAKKLDAKLTFIHVVKHLPDESDYGEASLKQLEEHLFAHAQKKMTALLDPIKASGQDCGGEILGGNIADSIIAYARDKAADLIVISTHGAQGIEKVLLGSVADRVIKGAHCPTLVFNPFKDERGQGTASP